MSAATTGLPPLVIPTMSRTRSKSRVDAITMYPTSPLGVFPPPGPAPLIRRSLRDRCGVNLTLEIDAPFKSLRVSHVQGPWSPKGHIQPHRTNLPRRRNPKPCFANFKDVKVEFPKPPTPKAQTPIPPAVAPVAFVAPVPADIPTPLQPPKADETHLQPIIPALWVAFGQALNRSYEEGFTHIVDICYADVAKGTSERVWEDRVQRLKLTLPEAARKWEGRAALALTDAQLRTARDFIAECLPQSIAALPDQTDVRVLVATPPGRPTDAMCVLGCYLAFVAGRDVETVLQCIDEEDCILSAWKGEVSGEEMERIEKIARGWSWLSAVATAAGRS
ncbi:hypothetical protein L226DRAFT_540189 [Lentinus tigrinus ALCF2SS1-7]|uniref:Uncharacterized protein n=1 Tax=Lentinus tigrinus ALCF2SS1-6 TaxID=1328759 RepID=A0A5C2S2Y2_9APHY|nr:hypothetical protein L227DRAFT_577537 [Lentinus tigrinus ALCF2SS1-6]RPD69025.1 hypothetical protein L226DRAFT_540189 [Lentinus tigrinus ALCF2SS1-7]